MATKRTPIKKQPPKSSSSKKQRGLKAVSLFAGAGGLDIALCETGQVAEIFSTDSHPVFLQTIAENLPRHFPAVRHSHLVADARVLTGAEILNTVGGPVDLVIGGPPCDNFTCFGKREGLSGEKGPLIFEFARLIAEIRPNSFLFENVPNLKRQFKDALGQLLHLLANCGYDVTNSALLSSPEFGSPTQRARLFVVGFRDKSAAKRFRFPKPTHGGQKDELLVDCDDVKPLVTVADVLGDLPDSSSEGTTFLNHTGRPHRPATVAHIMTIPQGVAVSKSFRYRPSWNGLCRSLTAGVDHSTKSYLHPLFHREMTVREYARLHGFPDTWRFCGNHHNGIKQVANAVPIQLGRAVLTAMCDVLQSGELLKR
jgi:DNA (cytosine-5)-methyltransferase 1